MRAVVRTDEGVLELNWQWLPTWVGMNHMLKADIERELSQKIVGREMTEETLNDIHDMIIDYLEARFGENIEGLRDYLDGLKFVQLRS